MKKKTSLERKIYRQGQIIWPTNFAYTNAAYSLLQYWPPFRFILKHIYYWTRKTVKIKGKWSPFNEIIQASLCLATWKHYTMQELKQFKAVAQHRQPYRTNIGLSAPEGKCCYGCPRNYKLVDKMLFCCGQHKFMKYETKFWYCHYIVYCSWLLKPAGFAFELF